MSHLLFRTVSPSSDIFERLLPMPMVSPATRPTSKSTSLRRELFLSFGVLFGCAILLASIGVVLVLPVLETAGETAFFIVCLLAADLSILFVFGRAVLRRSLFDPMDRLVKDANRIAEGDYEHRMQAAGTSELNALSENMNAMADRLIRDQRLLADNVRSLDDTNRELVEATAQVVRVARLASVGTLAAGIAHEIGNPLGAIMGYVDVAKRRVQEGGDAAEILEAAAFEARRIDRIVQSLLDYARPRRERHGPIDVDLHLLFARVRSLLEAQGQVAGITVDWEIQDAIAPIEGDLHHLEQILVNLFLNAVDALDGRSDRRIVCRIREEDGEGRVLLSRRKEDPPGTNYAHRRREPTDSPVPGEPDPFSTREAVRVVVLTLRDNGPGIEEGILEDLFDPFFTTKDPGKGTGLGLAICARLVEGMGGTITAENAPEGGAIFTLRFPRPQGGGAPAPAVEDSREGRGTELSGPWLTDGRREIPA